MRMLILMLSVVAAVAGAQVPNLASGSRLKIELTNHRTVEGTLMSQTSDSLVIAANGALVTGISSANVGRISSTLGRSHGAGAVKGTKIGVLIGGGLGVLVGLAVMNEDSLDQEFGGGGSAPVLFGSLGAAEGAFYGVIIGAIAGAQDWKEIYRRPYRVSLTPNQNGVKLGLTVTF